MLCGCPCRVRCTVSSVRCGYRDVRARRGNCCFGVPSGLDPGRVIALAAKAIRLPRSMQRGLSRCGGFAVLRNAVLSRCDAVLSLYRAALRCRNVAASWWAFRCNCAESRGARYRRCGTAASPSTSAQQSFVAAPPLSLLRHGCRRCTAVASAAAAVAAPQLPSPHRSCHRRTAVAIAALRLPSLHCGCDRSATAVVTALRLSSLRRSCRRCTAAAITAPRSFVAASSCHRRTAIAVAAPVAAPQSLPTRGNATTEPLTQAAGQTRPASPNSARN